jgi:hypothetical protein
LVHERQAGLVHTNLPSPELPTGEPIPMTWPLMEEEKPEGELLKVNCAVQGSGVIQDNGLNEYHVAHLGRREWNVQFKDPNEGDDEIEGYDPAFVRRVPELGRFGEHWVKGRTGISM